MSVSAHTVKRLDSASVHKALRGPTGQALLHPASTQRPALNTVRFEVSRSYEEEDNPANQAIGLAFDEALLGFRREVSQRPRQRPGCNGVSAHLSRQSPVEGHQA